MTTTTLKSLTASKTLLDAMHWDPDLNALRLGDDGRVMGLKCGLLPAENQASSLQPGDAFYRLISATFIDETATQGRHTVTVDVLNEDGRRLDGAAVEHGWPWERYPAMDEVVEATVFGASLAEWGLYARYDPHQVEYGPYWVRVKGAPSDVFFGMGLPWGHHISFTAVFQRMLWGGGPTGGDPTLAAIKADTQALLDRLNAVFK